MGNKTSLLSWLYQSAVDTDFIDAAGDTTYLFGGKAEDANTWTIPFQTNEVDAHYSYNSREATLTELDPRFETFKVPFTPHTAQYICWMLKQVTEDGGGVNIHKAEVLDSGLPLPMAMRYELNDGSVDRLYNIVNAYCVGLYCRAMLNAPFFVEAEFAYGRLEDHRGEWKADDTVAGVAGDVITLTDEPQRAENYYQNWLVHVYSGDQEPPTGTESPYTVSSSSVDDPPQLTLSSTPSANLNGDSIRLFNKARPKLTTNPVMPGESATTNYNGTPEVKWDTGDEDISLTECWKAEWAYSQTHKSELDANSKYQTVYLYKHEPVALTLECVLDRHYMWYDYIDRNSKSINVKVYKPNSSYYITHQFANCRVITAQETGHQNKGYYNTRLFLKTEAATALFTLESESNWSTHYKNVA